MSQSLMEAAVAAQTALLAADSGAQPPIEVGPAANGTGTNGKRERGKRLRRHAEPAEPTDIAIRH